MNEHVFSPIIFVCTFNFNLRMLCWFLVSLYALANPMGKVKRVITNTCIKKAVFKINSDLLNISEELTLANTVLHVSLLKISHVY